MTEPQESTQQPPSPEAQAAVAQATAEAAAAGKTDAQVADVAQSAAAKEGYQLSDEDAKKIAGMLATASVPIMFEQFEQRGVFVEAPEPVTPPEQAPPAPADAPAQTFQQDPNAQPASDEPPRKQTFAERHFS